MSLKFTRFVSQYAGNISSGVQKKFFSPSAALFVNGINKLETLYGNNPFKFSKEFSLIPKVQQHIDLPNPSSEYVDYMEIYERIPLLDISLPCISPIPTYEKPLEDKNKIGDLVEINKSISCKGGILKIRRKKMNKHKHKKRIKRDRAKIRKILNMRLRRKRKYKLYRKSRLIDKIKQRLDTDPQDTYGERPYVIHRLTKW